MPPSLAAIVGPLKGSIIDLGSGCLSVGREKGNQVRIKSSSVSRRHCEIAEAEGRFKITDLESSNGTFVNDVPVQERTLEHGDRIRVGDSIFLFSLHKGPSDSASHQVEIRGGTVASKPLELTLADTVSVDSFVSKHPGEDRLVRDLSALVEISTAINSIREVETLQRELLQAIFKVIPAQRGAILQLASDEKTIASVFGTDRSARSKGPVEVSRTIIKHVLEKGVALMSNNVLARDDLSGADSLRLEEIRSVLAVPLVAFEKKLGLIYLYSTKQKVRFDEGHLRLLTAISSMAAVALENARHMVWLGAEKQRLQDDLGIEHNMVGESPPMRKVHKFIAKVAPTEATVLIWGESGTGKELIARALHNNSPRADKPFVAINCAALAETLLESEMFGHEKGAFTGATSQKKGKLEVADGGTLFLDEIGELAPSLQAKLLRVLQEHEFERVGGTRTVRVDTRLITATNKDLAEAVRKGTFREDLYYRINVVSLETPPLRERRGDIVLLASYFAEKYGARCKRKIVGIAPEARESLAGYHWPGNVRELENAIERAVVLGSTEILRQEDLPEVVLEANSAEGLSTAKYHDAVLEAKKRIILEAFDEAGANHNDAAKRLDLHPNYLHRLLRNMNLRNRLKK
jgi:Nif-specific regulatory protein